MDVDIYFNHNLSQLFKNFFYGGGGKTTPCLWIILQILSLGCKHSQICSFTKYTLCYQNLLNFVEASIFLKKIWRFQAKMLQKVFFKRVVLELCKRSSQSCFQCFQRHRIVFFEFRQWSKYHYWSWDTMTGLGIKITFIYKGFDLICLNFVQCLGIGASKGCQIWLALVSLKSSF